jgi:hypothetical protein
LLYVADEAVATTVSAFDVLAAVGRASQQLAKPRDCNAEHALSDDPSIPHALGDPLSTEQLTWVAEKQRQQIEELCIDLQQLRAAPQLSMDFVE